MSASGTLSLLHTGGSRSFTSTFIPTPESYRSPPRGAATAIASIAHGHDHDHHDDSAAWHDYHYPTIHLSRLSKIINASLVLKGMASSDEEQKLDAPPAQQHVVHHGSHFHDHVPASLDTAATGGGGAIGGGGSPNHFQLTLSPLKHVGSRHNSPSPSTATASGIAAMSLSFIIHDNDDDDNNNVENTPATNNRRLSVKENEYRLGSIDNSIRLEHTPLAASKSLLVNVNQGSSAASPPSSSAGFGVSAILNTVCAKPDCYRTIRGPPGSFCKYHKQSRFCRADGCNKSAKTGGFCISHGGGKRCSFDDCSKSAKQGGLCISHGGGKRCSENGCTKSALVGGFCSAHGGGRKCRTSDCAKTALLGGYCIAHGGGKRCQVDGCAKSAVGGTLCVSHGGGKRCQTDGCNKGAVRNGVCIRHGAKRDGATSSNASGSPSPSPVKSIKDEFEFSP